MSIKSYKDKRTSTKTAYNGDKRVGFATKDRIPDSQLPDSRYTTRYGIGIDNLPLQGETYNEINTPFGTLDYGNGDDTGFVGFTPNYERTRDTWTGANGTPMMADYARSRIGDAIFQAGRQGAQSNPDYFAGAFLPGENQYIPTFDKQFNTPFGRVELESNYDAPNSIDARISPNYYVQALLNMLGR